MKRFVRVLPTSAVWVWRHSSAGIAVLLILAALAIGYRVGQSAPQPEPDVAAFEAQPSEGGKPQQYTCSMHPSVRLPDEDAKCPICFMDLIPVDEGGEGEGSETRLVLSEAAAAAARVETRKVGRLFPRANVRLFGKVTYDQTSVARLTAYFPGRIERFFVNYIGVPVSKGDHLAELYSPDLLAAFEELRQAVQAVENSEDATGIVRRSTRDTLVAAREKLRLFGLTEQQVADVESGELDGDRLTIYAPLGGVVTKLDVREGDYVDTGEPIATVADLSRLWLDLEAYESQLPMLRWGLPLSFTVEARPGETFKGRIAFIEPMVDERTRTAAVRVAVDNSDRRLKPGMFASAVARPKVAEGGVVVGDELAGRWVGPMHPTVVKDQPGACDICGMDLVTAESLGVVGDPGAISEPLVVPRSAVVFTGTRSIVYVAVPDAETPTYEAREVVLGPRAGDFYVVREGLDEGERVVTHGAFRIDSAMQIAAKPSMMSPGDDQSGRRAGHDHAGAAVPDRFIFGLKPVYAAYFDAQEALADDDLSGFKLAVRDLRTAVGLVEEVGLVGETLGAWRRAAAKLRVEADAVDIEAARDRFEAMSEGVVALQRRFGHHGTQTWHLAHCPMAFDNTGADWLQRGTRIDNPYFGASMLRCGEIRASFDPLDAGDDASHRGHQPGVGHDHE